MESAICCRAVCLLRNWDELRLAYNAAKAGRPSYLNLKGVEQGVPVDVVETFEMWEQLEGVFCAHPFIPEQKYDPPVKLYQCRHVANGLCSIWSKRPEMCRRYSCLAPGQELFQQGCASFGKTCFPSAYAPLDIRTKTIIDSAGRDPAKS